MVAKFIPMKYGEESDRVKKAQKLLQKSGSTIKENGVYTIGMASAVRAFQKKNKLPVTGVIDAKTFSKLLEYDKPAKPVRRKTK